MGSEQRLYTLSDDTKTHLRKFRLGTSRAKDPQAVIYVIDKKTLEIHPEDQDEVYNNLQDLADAIPDNIPRFALLSYPMTLASGRQTVPYVLISYMPSTCNSELRMLYAGAKELLRTEAEANRVLDIRDAEDITELEDRLKGED